MSRAIYLSVLMIIAGAVAAPPAQASGCSVGAEGQASCQMDCEQEANSVTVSASISSFFLQWRTIEGEAYCNGALAAVCAGHGSCTGAGGGAQGPGYCIFRTGQGVDFTGGCAANGSDLTNIEIERILTTATATYCSSSGCIDVPVTCVEGDVDVACAVGMTATQISERYPDL